MSGRERTFIMVKPDGVQRGLVGEVIGRLERKGLQPAAVKLMQLTPEMAASHYAEHREKPFYADLVGFITSGPVVAMVWEGDGAVALARTLIGATDPQKAAPGTIRGDLAVFTGNNIVHGSDSPESARREINLFFDEAELCRYRISRDEWVYGE